MPCSLMELARSSSFSSSKKVLGWYWFSEIFEIGASLVASGFVALIGFLVEGGFLHPPTKLQALYLVVFFLPFSNFLINSPDKLKNASAPIDFIS